MSHPLSHGRGGHSHGQSLMSHMQPNDIAISTNQDESFPGSNAIFRDYPPEKVVQLPYTTTDKAKIATVEGANLKVKYSRTLGLANCQTQRYVEEHMSRLQIPVAKTYGWRYWEGQWFLYMSIVPGENLDEEHGDGNIDEQGLEGIWTDLDTMRNKWEREIPVKYGRMDANSDHLFNKINPRLPGHLTLSNAEKAVLPGDHFPYHFGHGDLVPGNLMVRKVGGKWVISGIVDWDTAGWYAKWHNANRIAKEAL